MTTERCDCIVVGAGSAGCVLEAGGDDGWIWFHIPVGYLFAIGNPRADWMYETQAIAGLDGRRLNNPPGKVIGGYSAINAKSICAGRRRTGTGGGSWAWRGGVGV